MGLKTLELTSMSAKDLKNVNLIGKMDPYVIVHLTDDPKNKQKTPVHQDAGTNPSWNYTMRFTVDDVAASQPGKYLVITIKHEQTFGADKDLGEVLVPLKELLDGVANAKDPSAPLHVTYQVRRVSSGKAQGEFKMTYKVVDNNNSMGSYGGAKGDYLHYVQAQSSSGSGHGVYPPPGGYPAPQLYGNVYPPPGAAYPPPGGYPAPQSHDQSQKPYPPPGGYPPPQSHDQSQKPYPPPQSHDQKPYPPPQSNDQSQKPYPPPQSHDQSHAAAAYPPPGGYPQQSHGTGVPYTAEGYPSQSHGAGVPYGAPAPSHGYPQHGYGGYPPPPQAGYGYGAYPPPGGYPGYPPAGYPQQQGYAQQKPQKPKKGGGGLGMGLGAGLLGGAVGGLVLGEMMDDAFDVDCDF